MCYVKSESLEKKKEKGIIFISTQKHLGINNFEASDILPSSKLTTYQVTVASQIHWFWLVREEGWFISHSDSNSQIINIFVLVPWARVPEGHYKESQMTHEHAVIDIAGKEIWAQGIWVIFNGW